MSLQQHAEKKYDPLDATLKFVDRKDDLDPLGDDEDSLRAEMSCGHAVTPESLTLWCRSQLDEGIYKFRCPAIVEGTKQCNKEWSYTEVRRLADLTVEEIKYFEETIASLATAQYCEIQPCPQCKTNVERKDLSNLCVQCTICTADQEKTYQFCWQCLKQWKGPGPRSDRCDNNGCTNKDLQLLQMCKNISLPQFERKKRATDQQTLSFQDSYCQNLSDKRIKNEPSGSSGEEIRPSRYHPELCGQERRLRSSVFRR
ncbi:hypothetical protein Q5P01_002572 [Channa striata]|uniref:RING-type domain-containing protein n=1 Tax=Channa striata TaxID=64152 RepID=A0AA88NRL7_CHASR|nr:hypothetical protein Q5P01_002572 [Channa striata]